MNDIQIDTLKPWKLMPPRLLRRPLWVALAVFLGISAMVISNWHVLDLRQQRDSQHRFNLDVATLNEALLERMHAYEMVLRGVSGIFTGERVNFASYAQWNDVVAQLRVWDLYPGISSLVWSRYLYTEDVDAFVARQRADGRPNFQLFPQGVREHYLPVEYIGPLNERTARVRGLDLLSQYPQAHAVTQAIDSGRATLSLPVSDLYRISSPDESNVIGVLFYFPVYRRGTPPDTVEQRRATFIGATNMAFRGQELVQGLFGTQLRLFEIIAHDTENNLLLFDSRQLHPEVTPPGWQPQFHTTVELSLYGRTWHLDITGTPEYERALVSRSHDLILIMGLSTAVLLALLAGGFVWQWDRQVYAKEKVAATLHEQAQQLMVANRYKTEFLANMSHELRTPLNSILILSDQLRQNTAGNLSQKQTRHADIVYRAGNDLLQLINDVLDLAKIEAGRIQISLEPLSLQDVLIDLDAAMRPLAETKGLHLYIPPINKESGIPQKVEGDRGRLHQILRNLLSNAIKFTDEGQVNLSVRCGQPREDGRILFSFVVRDTGIGIDPSQHEQVFEAFAQLDGSTRRRFGGTGLGLPITRQLVHTLGGEIELHSTAGQGAEFSVHLPMKPVMHAMPAISRPPERSGEGPPLLIVEDDAHFASIIIEQAQQSGFSCVHCSNGQQALDLLRKEQFAAVILDILLPDFSGWQLFRQMRTQSQHLHTPVHIISCLPQPANMESERSTHYLTKPISREALEQVFSSLQLCQHPSHGTLLLLVEDVASEREYYQQQLSALGFAVTACENAQQACALWEGTRFEVVVIDLNLPDLDGFTLLENLNALRPLQGIRIIINTGMDVAISGLQRLERYSATVVQKNGTDTADLKNAVHGFLGQLHVVAENNHRPPNNSPSNTSRPSPLPETPPAIASVAVAIPTTPSGHTLQGCRVLLVDDDVRNVYAMSALLDDFGLIIHTASHGEEAIACFQQQPLDLILMDMSMPVMDGYTATNLLKTRYGCTLPIIALTAHAMKGDREKCLAVGADDYLSKPVQREELRVLLERWLLTPVENQGE